MSSSAGPESWNGQGNLRKLLTTFGILMLLSQSGVTVAQTLDQADQRKPGEQAESLDIDSAISNAIQNDPRSEQIRWQIESAIATRFQSTRRPNPTVGVLANEIGNDGSAGQYGAFVSRNIVRNGRFDQNFQLYTAQVNELECGKELRQLQLARRVSLRYLAVAKNQRDLKLANDYLKSLNEIKAVVDRLTAAGEIAAFSGTAIELEIESQRQKIAAFESQHRNLVRQLAVSISGNESDSLEIQFDWETAVAAVAPEQPDNLIEQLIPNHPEVCQSKARIQQAQWRIELAKSQQCPDYQLQASINYDAASDDLFAGFQFGVPLLRNDRKSGLIRAANANLKAAHEQQKNIMRQLQQNLVTQTGNQAVTRKRLLKMNQTLLTLAEKNLSQVRKAFEAGSVSFLQVKEAVSVLQNARLAKASLEYDLLVSQAKIETVTSED